MNIRSLCEKSQVTIIKYIRKIKNKHKRLLAMQSNFNDSDIKTYVFFDTETTGLPSAEHNKTKIVELCLAAVQAEHISLGVFPRIIPKISLCFNPQKMINPMATEVSGLTNELLQAQPKFGIESARLLHDFLNMQRKPLCFVAHNGNRFDYPILRAELYKLGKELPEGILCVDSLIAFRHWYTEDVRMKNSPNIPFELQDGYDHLLCKVLEDLENSVDDPVPLPKTKRLTIQEIQKRNETTPQKQIIFSSNRISSSSKVSKQLNFGDSQSFKLTDLYHLVTQKTPTDAHKAEYDVEMLIECMSRVGERFLNFANASAVKFCDIPMMQPGRSIGT